MIIGDTVKIKVCLYNKGKRGVIRVIQTLSIGVEFRGWGAGHRLDGSLKKDDGRWYGSENLELVSSKPIRWL